jgi:hypothetical protein
MAEKLASSKAYKIVYEADTSMCIGVVDVQAGEGACLRSASDLHTTWNLDLDAGALYLDASGSQLALTNQGAGKQLVLTEYSSTGPTDAQRWDFQSRPGFIISAVEPEQAIDNRSRVDKEGNVVQAYAFNGSAAQMWRLVGFDATK